MKTLLLSTGWFYWVISSLALAPLQAQEAGVDPWRKGPEVSVGKDFVLPAGKRIREVTVISGSATIEGTVEHDLVVVSGDVTLNGKVNKDMVVVLGSAKLGPGSEVRHDVIVVGGTLTRDPEAKIGGEVVEIDPVAALDKLGFGGFAGPAFAWLKGGLLHARPMAPKVSLAWATAGIFLLIYCLMALLFKRALAAGVETVETRPVGAFFTGFLVFLLMLPVTLLLVASGVGIVLVPFLLCALIFVFFLGKTTVYQFVGFQFSDSFRASVGLSLVALIVGTVIFLLLYMIPVIGFIVWGLVTVWGIGAVTLASFRLFRREKAAASATVSFTPPLASPEPQNPPVLAPAGASAAGAVPPPVSYALAGFWIRLLAMLLDFILVGGVLAVLRAQKLFLFVWLVYHVGFGIWKSMTLGDIIVGIKCTRTDGQPMNIAASIIRALASVFSAMAFGLGFFWAGWDRQKQSWHDKIAGTYMVKVPKGASLV